jgi:hypothetical protein
LLASCFLAVCCLAKSQQFLDVLATIDVDNLTHAQLVELFKLLVKHLQARMLHEGA